MTALEAPRRIHPGDTNRAILARRERQHVLVQPVAEWPAVRIVRDEEGRYAAKHDGVYRAARTHETISSGRFGAKKTIDGETFLAICHGNVTPELSKWRDEELIAAAVAFCEWNAVRGYDLSVVSGALCLVLACQHGCGSFSLMDAGAFLDTGKRSEHGS